MTVEKTPLGDILTCATLHATCYTINREICPKHQSAPITFWRKQRYNRNVAGDTKSQLCGGCGDKCHPGWRMITFCFNYYTHQWALMDAPLKSHYNTLFELDLSTEWSGLYTLCRLHNPFVIVLNRMSQESMGNNSHSSPFIRASRLCRWLYYWLTRKVWIKRGLWIACENIVFSGARCEVASLLGCLKLIFSLYFVSSLIFLYFVSEAK